MAVCRGHFFCVGCARDRVDSGARGGDNARCPPPTNQSLECGEKGATAVVKGGTEETYEPEVRNMGWERVDVDCVSSKVKTCLETPVCSIVAA